MSSSKIFLFFLLSFISGILIASFFNIPKLLVWEFFILGIFYIGFAFTQRTHLFKRSKFQRNFEQKMKQRFIAKAIVVFAVCLIIFGLGIIRYQFADKNFEQTELKKFNDISEQVEILGAIIKEPDVRENNVKLTINVEELNNVKMEGRILITITNDFFYHYGDNLKIRGFLKTPKVFEDFHYKDYLKKDNISAVIYNPQIEIISRNFTLLGNIFSFKNKLRATLEQGLFSPQSSILSAILLGDKQKISSLWKEKLNIAGVRHITAVSGMHIIILGIILMSVLIGLGLHRSRAFYFTLIILWFYIVMIGFHASAVRAGIMASFLLFGKNIGRSSANSHIIVFAGALMLLINPFLLKYDVGFQLSFLAVIGIIYLGPVFKNWLKFIPAKRLLNLRSVLTMTFSAQVFTLPILIYNFGYFSLISPLANILIVPILPLIMISGFLFVFLGAICPPLIWLFSLPVWLLLKYLTSIISFLSKIPLASLSFQMPWFYLLIFYTALIYFVYRLNRLHSCHSFSLEL